MQVLSRLAEKMKRDVDVGLVADFRRFHREKAAASRAMLTLDTDVLPAFLYIEDFWSQTKDYIEIFLMELHLSSYLLVPKF